MSLPALHLLSSSGLLGSDSGVSGKTTLSSDREPLNALTSCGSLRALGRFLMRNGLTVRSASKSSMCNALRTVVRVLHYRHVARTSSHLDALYMCAR